MNERANEAKNELLTSSCEPQAKQPRALQRSPDLKNSRPITERRRTHESSSSDGTPTHRLPLSRLSVDYRPHPGQELFHRRPERMRIIAAGSRWGKDTASLMEMLALVTTAASADRPTTLIPRVHAWVVTPNYPLSSEPWRVVKRTIAQLNPLINESHKSIELPGDILLEFKSAERPETLVGSGLDVLVLLEAALIPEVAWTTSLRPRLASPGRWGVLIASGTPKGRNWFHRLFLSGQDEQNIDIWSAQFATWDNPLIDPAEIDAMRDMMPERSFAQEVGGEFVTDDGAVFHGVRACIVPPRSAQGDVAVGVDFGMRQDSTAVIALDRSGHVVGFDCFRRIPYEQIIDRVAAFILNQRARIVIPESNGVGDPLCELLEKKLAGSNIRVAPFVTTSSSKRQIIDRLAISIEQRKVSFPDIPRLVNELEIFEFATSQTGTTRFNAPTGAHDDCVMALALAHHAFGSVRVTRPPIYGVFGGGSSRRENPRASYDDGSIWHTII